MSQFIGRGVVTPIYPEKGRSLFALCVTSIVLCTVTLILRFWSRATLPAGTKFAADDWTALGAWCFFVTQYGVVTAGTRTGYGLPISEIPYDNLVRILQYFYVSFITYNVGIALVRISALLFYRRVFRRANRILEYLISGTIVFNIMWMVGFNLMSIFSCWPVQAYWDRTISNYRCQPTMAQQWASGITSVIVDVWILLLPIPTLWRLRMTAKKRLLVVGVFLIGYSVVFCTIGRLVSVIVAGPALDLDVTLGFVTTSYWFACEGTVALCGLSVPSIFYLGVRMRKHGLRSAITDSEFTEGRRLVPPAESSGYSRPMNTDSTLEVYSNDDGAYDVHIGTRNGSDPASAKDSIALHERQGPFIHKLVSVSVGSSTTI